MVIEGENDWFKIFSRKFMDLDFWKVTLGYERPSLLITQMLKNIFGGLKKRFKKELKNGEKEG